METWKCTYFYYLKYQISHSNHLFYIGLLSQFRGRWVLWIYIQRIPVTIKGCFFTWKFQIYFHWCLQYHKSIFTSIIMLFNCIMFLLLWKKLITMCMWYSLVIQAFKIFFNVSHIILALLNKFWLVFVRRFQTNF